ncbi:MAG: L-seryl-tRNA(Sec) selenium transferase [Clostridia bacterium]|nr:L-seryl-tRNA(Sec) selenium transferase [Clostridia bacterium]
MTAPGLRDLPAVHDLLAHPAVAAWADRIAAPVRTRLAQALVGEWRERLRSGEEVVLPAGASFRDVLGQALAARLESLWRGRLRRVINATGVVLHTNLGRAPLPEAALEAVAALRGYWNLEFDLEEGERGDRSDLVADLLRVLTGAEACLVVNNNAAAVLLLLAAVASGREVVVSRGELVEIGGSFRVPEVMAASGAILREVGTTNRTYARDYERALGPSTAALLKVHRSNFTLAGFTHDASLEELAALGRERGLPVLFDLGSGALAPEFVPALSGEPTVAEALAAGADVVTFSGDKLLGGPQCGIIAGRADLVRACARHPLYRALRVDKVTLAMLTATLRAYLHPDNARAEIPALAMLAMPAEALAARARALAARLREALGPAAGVDTRAGASVAGGGSAPAREMPTTVVAVRPVRLGAAEAARRLRRGDPAVVVRVAGEAILVDPRTLDPDDDDAIVLAFARALSPGESSRAPG